MNLYNYVFNDPTSLLDPDGKVVVSGTVVGGYAAWEIGVLVGAGAGAIATWYYKDEIAEACQSLVDELEDEVDRLRDKLEEMVQHQLRQRRGSCGEDAVPGQNDLDIAKTAQDLARALRELAEALARCTSLQGDSKTQPILMPDPDLPDCGGPGSCTKGDWMDYWKAKGWSDEKIKEWLERFLK
jgi:hypothetical protein